MQHQRLLLLLLRVAMLLLLLLLLLLQYVECTVADTAVHAVTIQQELLLGCHFVPIQTGPQLDRPHSCCCCCCHWCWR
jgi:hypothetical protein